MIIVPIVVVILVPIVVDNDRDNDYDNDYDKDGAEFVRIPAGPHASSHAAPVTGLWHPYTTLKFGLDHFAAN